MNKILISVRSEYMSKRSSKSAYYYDIFKKQDYSSRSIEKENSRSRMNDFKPKIYLKKDSALNKMDVESLIIYVQNLQRSYTVLRFNYIRKPSLSDLFNSADNAKTVEQLVPLIKLMHRNIRDLERRNYRVERRRDQILWS